MKFALIFLLFFFPLLILAQSPKIPLDHSTYDIWNRISNVQITRDGRWIFYQLSPGQGDAIVKIYNKEGVEKGSFHRAKNASFTWDADFAVFFIGAPDDTVKNLRRLKTKKEDLPKDTLAILQLSTQNIVKIPNVKGYKLPAEWSGHLAYLLDPVKMPEDTTIADSLRVVPKPCNDDNGYTLIIRNLKTAQQDTFRYVMDFKFSRFGNTLAFHSTGDSTLASGVYHYDCAKSALNELATHKGKYTRLTLDESGRHVAFMADPDTTNNPQRQHKLFYWNNSYDSAVLALDTSHVFMPKGWMINEKDTLYFSENGQRLFFGIMPKPPLADTMLLEEEIVNVEIWNYQDQRLHTQQNVELKKDQKKAFLCWFDTQHNTMVQLGNENIPKVIIGAEGNAAKAIGLVSESYQKSASWEGEPVRQDVYAIDMHTVIAIEVKKALRSYQTGVSPGGNFFYWIDTKDSCWYAYSITDQQTTNLSRKIPFAFTSEINDQPAAPYPYGIAGWTEKDEFLLVYDRYDIWRIDPLGKSAAINLTNGRDARKVYRYLKLDQRDKFIDSKQTMLLHTYNEVTRDEGYAKLNIRKAGTPTKVIEDKFNFSKPVKALENDQLLYTKQRYDYFPDLLLSDDAFSQAKQISHANPQQNDYAWGTAEIVQWTSLDGHALEGMLFKPENFDPAKKYPLIVNFYEKSSTEIHNHRFPKPERSTINYPLYVSNGYVIFNPDVHYRTGYPGESCYNSVIPGVTKLIEAGFIDKDRIGVQGHSWGGYQIAYLITKTDMFAAAEAGAPVANMTSAYGGIRWWTGLSRMFQYEHTQSRIGGTLWDYAIRFIENSPIFFVDKINTPLLIMHNDADGHVPWYQGIEMFVAMRRLNKPSWMLNYPGEPHWPLKRQNQVDFNIRMMQFFDHYLKSGPVPKWMRDGVPATVKSIDLGYELGEE